MGSVNNFLNDLVERVYKQHKDGLDEVSLIFPTRGAAYAFRAALGKKLAKPQWSFRSYTLSDFMQTLAPGVLASKLVLLGHLHSVVAAVKEEMSCFADFYTWGSMFLGDVEDMAYYQVPLEALLDHSVALATSVSGVMREREREDKKGVEKALKVDSVGFSSMWEAIYRGFHERLQRYNVTYRARYYQQIHEQLLAGRLSHDHGHIIMVNVYPMYPLVKDLFRALAETATLEYHVDVDAYYMEDGQHGLGKALRKQSQEALFGQYVQGPYVRRITADLRVRSIMVPRAIHQVQALVTKLEALACAADFRADDVTIALADRELLMPLLNALPRWEVSVDLAYPFSDTPIYGWLLLVMDWYVGWQKGGGEQKRGLNDCLMRLLAHPYTRLSGALVEGLTEMGGVTVVGLGGLRGLPAVWRCLLGGIERRDNVLTYFEELLLLLKGGGLADRDWVAWEAHSLEVALGWCVNMGKVVGVPRLLSGRWVSFLQQELCGLVLDLGGGTKGGMRITGVRDTLGVSMRYLFVLSMNEGVFPVVRRGSHLSLRLRERYVLTHDYDQQADGFLFYYWLQNTEALYLFYYEKESLGKAAEPSRFVLQLDYALPCRVHKEVFAPVVSHASSRSISIAKNDAVYRVLEGFLGSGGRVLTPTAINTYIDCKLRFYFKYIAKIAPASVAENVRRAGLFGKVLHRSMEVLYGGYVGQWVDVGGIKRCEEAVDGVVSEAAGYYKHDLGGIPSGWEVLIREVIARLVREILKVDAGYAPFRLLGVEMRDMELRYGFGDGAEVRLGGVIDRVDEKEGVVRVVDYKTGGFSSAVGRVESLFDGERAVRNATGLQAIWYAWLYATWGGKYGVSVVRPTIMSTRNIFEGMVGMGLSVVDDEGKRGVMMDVGGYSDVFEKGLSGVLGELFDRDSCFDQTTVLSRCVGCPYKEICGR